MQDPDRLWFSRSDWDPSASAFTAPAKGRIASEFRHQTTDTEYVCGAALFFRADVVRQIGLLDERFFLVYEDSDWCFRARRAGLSCLMVPTARVWHKIGTSFGSEASPLRGYFSTRNKLLWAEKNVSRREWWGMLCAALSRFYPSLAVDREAAGSRPRALWWAAAGFAREWGRRLRDPLEIAHRRGVMDYLLRRFGDCPARIRVLTKLWASAQTDAGGARPDGARDLTSRPRPGHESASP
jgi:GT2 family glycosyltransferase